MGTFSITLQATCTTLRKNRFATWALRTNGNPTARITHEWESKASTTCLVIAAIAISENSAPHINSIGRVTTGLLRRRAPFTNFREYSVEVPQTNNSRPDDGNEKISFGLLTTGFSRCKSALKKSDPPAGRIFSPDIAAHSVTSRGVPASPTTIVLSY